MYRISKVILKNFKFFYGTVEILFDRKNVLLYGENGSGKSSIYWALYTFLQSVFKNDVRQVHKYFEHNNPQNLRNRFAKDTADSAVVLEFEDDSQSVTRKQVSNKTVNTRVGGLISNCNQSSDFINYKLLSKVYDFSNLNQIDLFPLFERDLLMFIDLNLKFKNIDGSIQNSNANDWWQYLKPGMNPRPRMHDPEYIIFSENVNNFNSEFRKYLFKIIETANDYVQKEFKQPLKLKLEYVEGSYDAFEDGSTTKRNHITISPKIILTVEFIHKNLNTFKRDILRPQTFLNEARLTTIALSLRFAMLDEKYIESAPKILVLDDLLISLDMSNRDIVLDLIISKFKKYQIIMMTHDRSFFNLMRRRIELDQSSEEWITKDIYSSELPNGIPVPFIPDNKDYLDQAVKYLKEFDYPACANYLRKESEKLLKHLLPYNKRVEIKDEEPTRPLQLDTLIDNFKKHYLKFENDFTPFKKIKEHKDMLLNPLSHDNLDSPIYKQELIDIFNTLKELRKLDFKCLVSIKEKLETYVYLPETSANGELWVYKILLKENLCAFKKLDSTWVLNNPLCIFVGRKRIADDVTEQFSNEMNLNHGYDQIRHALGIKGNPGPNLLDLIVNEVGENINSSLNGVMTI